MLSPARGRKSGSSRWPSRSGGVWPPRANQAVPEHDGEPGRQDVDGDAAHHLVAAIGDAGEAVQQRQRLGGEDGRGHARPGRAGDRRGRGGEEGRHQHLAFEADIDDAALLREQPAHGAEHQRRRDPQRRRPASGRRRRRPRPSRAPGARTATCSQGRGRCASAPENRMTRPWITTTISRVMVGISKASSAPPCCSAPNSSAASTMPSGWLRPIRATAMPAKP